MQFKYPEILYALFLLLIPIVIHLFQLRRFQKVPFTNVAFLKKISVQTRKSSQLKKWLVLILRSLALACLVIAFAQPYSTTNVNIGQASETVIYIDNSFSMQAKGSQGPLLERAVQDLFGKNAGNEQISWFSNNQERRQISTQDFDEDVLKIDYSPNQLSAREVLLKADQIFSDKKGVQRTLIYISDFQLREDFPPIPEDMEVNAVWTKPVNTSNISIDSVFVSGSGSSKIELMAKISQQGDNSQEVPISLFNKEKLIAKTAIDFSNNAESSVPFEIEMEGDVLGKLEITDQNLPFDNTLYFSVNKPKKINVMSINAANGQFLNRIFGGEQFQLLSQDFNSLDYSFIPEQNLIVLNGLADIPASLVAALKSFSAAGGSILVIPAMEINKDDYNVLLQQLNLGTISDKISGEKKITGIVFAHPLFQNVFEKEVINFQYPQIQSYYPVSSGATAALNLEDQRPFLLQRGKNYFFTAALDTDNSNFVNSPLIVPTLYNMALQSLPLPRLYNTIGRQNTFAVPVTLGPDEILKIADSTSQFIPLQQNKGNHVLITTSDNPARAGTYAVTRGDAVLQYVSFNYFRKESNLEYANPENWEGANVFSNVNEVMEIMAQANSINSFWKWFAIFALFFLICEMVILKFVK